MALKQFTGRYTVDDLYRLVERGILREDDRVELIHAVPRKDRKRQ